MFGLDKGLFKDDFKSGYYKINGYPEKNDFIELAKRIKIQEKRIEKILAPFLEKQAKVEELTERSFLNEKIRKAYINRYNERRNHLIK